MDTGFGQRLKHVLQEKGMTQAKLSEDTGISPPNISRLCRSRRMPAEKTLLTLIENLYPIDIYWFLFGRAAPGIETKKDP